MGLRQTESFLGGTCGGYNRVYVGAWERERTGSLVLLLFASFSSRKLEKELAKDYFCWWIDRYIPGENIGSLNNSGV